MPKVTAKYQHRLLKEFQFDSARLDSSPLTPFPRKHKQIEKEKEEREQRDSLLDDPLNSFQALLQHVHARAVAQPDEMMTRRVEQVSAATGVQIEEDAGHNDDFFLEAFFEEGEPIVDGGREAGEVEPDVECAVLGEGVED
jgi:hypothetical protein